MTPEFTREQTAQRHAFRKFAEERLSSHAARSDREETFSDDLVREMAAEGYLGATIARRYAGREYDSLALGLLHEELGRVCTNARSLLTVHGMVSQALHKWGSETLRERWLPAMARGEKIGAFCLTEDGAGSDAKSITAEAREERGGFVLSGRKKWTTFGRLADLFLVFAQQDGRMGAFLVERNRAGVAVEPTHGLLGMRGSLISTVTFDRCWVPAENVVGRVGFGFSHVGAAALDLGRYTVAWGCVGIGQACLEASIRYASERVQFGVPIAQHQLVQQMLTDMLVDVEAARLLCCRAGYLRDTGDSRATLETLMAKYQASTSAARIASNALQVHGGNGCSREYPVERHFRDARIMEIIEGSTQIQQITISRYAQRAWREHMEA